MTIDIPWTIRSIDFHIDELKERGEAQNSGEGLSDLYLLARDLGNLWEPLKTYLLSNNPPATALSPRITPAEAAIDPNPADWNDPTSAGAPVDDRRDTDIKGG